jgi:hypothetical protein
VGASRYTTYDHLRAPGIYPLYPCPLAVSLELDSNRPVWSNVPNIVETPMALPNLIPESAIIEREKRWNEQHHLMLASPYYAESMKEKRRLQREWLALYSTMLSPTMVNKRMGITDAQYRGWLDRDPMFARMFNDTLESVRDELAGVAIGRAIGEAVADENGNHVIDAAGRPVYRNGSDRLMTSLLGLEAKDQEADVVVSIEIVSR